MMDPEELLKFEEEFEKIPKPTTYTTKDGKTVLKLDLLRIYNLFKIFDKDDKLEGDVATVCCTDKSESALTLKSLLDSLLETCNKSWIEKKEETVEDDKSDYEYEYYEAHDYKDYYKEYSSDDDFGGDPYVDRWGRMRGGEPDYTACSADDCGYCGRCQY